MSLLSVIIPSYNEESNIANTSSTLKDILSQANINFELIFVNDGSIDNTKKLIKSESQKDKRIVGVNFSRNFGKEACIFAGLNQAKGDCCVVMDCDLQHPPETVVEMYHCWEDGYEVVEGIKSSRGKESLAHKIMAKTFYKLMGSVTKIDPNSSDFKLLDRKVVNVLTSLTEKNTFFRALSFWAGFKKTKIVYEVNERKFGNTKWSSKSLIKYAVSNITAFTSIPLQFITFCGIILILFFFVLAIQTLIKYFTHTAVEGFTTVIILILLVGGCIMLALGIMGYYISKIFEEIKSRPKYIVDEVYNDKNKIEEESDDR